MNSSNESQLITVPLRCWLSVKITLPIKAMESDLKQTNKKMQPNQPKRTPLPRKSEGKKKIFDKEGTIFKENVRNFLKYMETFCFFSQILGPELPR